MDEIIGSSYSLFFAQQQCVVHSETLEVECSDPELRARVRSTARRVHMRRASPSTRLTVHRLEIKMREKLRSPPREKSEQLLPLLPLLPLLFACFSVSRRCHNTVHLNVQLYDFCLYKLKQIQFHGKAQTG